MVTFSGVPLTITGGVLALWLTLAVLPGLYRLVHANSVWGWLCDIRGALGAKLQSQL